MLKINHLLPELRGYLISVIFIISATAVFLFGRQYFAKGQEALLYLLVIMFVASISGVRPALFASVLAFLFLNYFFIPPYHTFIVYDEKDWLLLIVFGIAAIIIGLQTGKLRNRESQALAREREAALLNRFSAHLVSEISTEKMADVLVNEVRANTGSRRAALFISDKSGKLREVSFTVDTQYLTDSYILRLVEWAYRESKAIGIPEFKPLSLVKPVGWPISMSHLAAGFDLKRNDIFLPLQTASKNVGVLYIGERRDKNLFNLSEVRLLVAVANQAAAFLERKQLHSLAVQADALQEADRLKSTFISSVSHELKTPLASITATVTNILEGDIELDKSTIRSELEAVAKDLERLNNSISSLIDFSRLESTAWKPKKEKYKLGEILGTTLSRISEKYSPRISFILPDDLPIIYVDFIQMSRVLQNLLENAFTYSDNVSSIRVGASCDGKDVKIWVEDEGPGIPLKERELIFEKFYRGAASAKMPSGTGLGLAIASEIVKSHKGKIWVEDVSPHGAKIVISLPKEELC